MLRALCTALLLCGCAQRAAPPSADTEQRPFPDMSGATIMVLPVQGATPTIGGPAGAPPPTTLGSDARATLEAELSFWLPEAAPRVRWILPGAVEQSAARAPTLDLRVRDLPVQDFLRARLTSIGDPLYGELRKVALLFNVRPALIPIGAVWVPDAAGGGRVQLAVALVDTTGGAVLWYGIVAGTNGARSDATTIASVAQALARMAAR